MICLVFANEVDAQTATEQIWKNYIVDIATNTPERVAYPAVTLSAMTPHQAAAIPIFNYKNGEINTDDGFTTRLVQYRPKYGTSDFYCPKPDVAYMTDVMNYTEASFDASWEEPLS